ncbi:extracellular solute-binding protein [Lacticaseibacillus suihuaensis]
MHRKVAILATAAATILALAGCSTGNKADTDKKAAKDDGKELTVTVYDDLANYAGIAKGWYANYIKDKFNIKLKMVSPNVAGGGSTLFDTRTAAGNLGDLIITGTTHTKKLVKAGLLADMTPYADGMTYIKKYKASSDELASIAGKKGLWGLTTGVSSMSPTKPSEGQEPAAAPYIRWDLYKEIGYPKIKTMNDLVPVLKKMQDQARKDTGDKDIWAVSLFKDWDGTNMQNAAQNLSFYGWEINQGTVLSKGNGKAYQSIVASDSQYVKGIKFLNLCKQAGILDPDSSTQTWTQIDTKVRSGKVLFSWWNFLGISGYNTSANTAQGKGFALAPVQDLNVTSNGASPAGGVTMIGIGSKAKNKTRLVKFINWLYSPEGVQVSQAGNIACAGIKGVMWKMQDGQPVLTKLGDKILNDDQNTKMPKKYGGTSFQDGLNPLNFKTVLQYDKDPTTGQAYNYNMWPSVIKASETKLSKDWSKHMDGATSTMDYLEKKNQLEIAAGVAYTAPEDPSVIATQRSTIGQQVTNTTWKMIMAKTDTEYNSLLANMQKTVNGLGYKDVNKYDMKNAKAKNKMRKDVIKEYKADK